LDQSRLHSFFHGLSDAGQPEIFTPRMRDENSLTHEMYESSVFRSQQKIFVCYSNNLVSQMFRLPRK
jgi:hypothetical protein